MTASQAAQRFNVSSQTIRRFLQSGKLTGYKVNGQWVVEVSFIHHATDVPHDVTPVLHSEIKHLRELLFRRSDEVGHLTQLLAVAQKTIQQLTEQNHLLLEDQRQPPFWKRLLSRMRR